MYHGYLVTICHMHCAISCDNPQRYVTFMGEDKQKEPVGVVHFRISQAATWYQWYLAHCTCHRLIPGTLPPETWHLCYKQRPGQCPTVCHQVQLTCDMTQAFRREIDEPIDIKMMMRWWWSVLVMLKTWGWSIQWFALPALSEPINCRYRDSIMLQRFYACRSVCIDHTTKSCVGCIVKKKLHTWCC